MRAGIKPLNDRLNALTHQQHAAPVNRIRQFAVFSAAPFKLCRHIVGLDRTAAIEFTRFNPPPPTVFISRVVSTYSILRISPSSSIMECVTRKPSSKPMLQTISVYPAKANAFKGLRWITVQVTELATSVCSINSADVTIIRILETPAPPLTSASRAQKPSLLDNRPAKCPAPIRARQTRGARFGLHKIQSAGGCKEAKSQNSGFC